MRLKSGIMAYPDHFGIEYELDTNLSMDKNRQPDKMLTMNQWNNLRNTLTECGVEILTLPSAGPGIPDFTFVANAGLLIPGTNVFILSNFHHEERMLEIPHLKHWLQNYFDLRELAPDEKSEGAGDAFFWHNNVFFIGFGIRTNLKGAQAVAKIVHEVDPRIVPEFLPMKFWVEDGERGKVSFYHRDMVLLPMYSKKRFLVYPYSFELNVLRTLERYGRVTLATKEQAYNFVCNGIEIDENTIILPWADEYTLEQFKKEFGYKNIIICPTGEFQKSGGGPQCLLKIIGQIFLNAFFR